MRCAVVSAWDDGFNTLAAITWPAIMAYCSSLGYDPIRATVESSRPASWSKVPALRRLLDNYDAAFWVDADAVILGDSYSIQDLLIDKDVAIACDENGINAGVIILRSCDWIKTMLDVVNASYPNWQRHIWWEQRPLGNELHKRWDRVRVVPKSILNAYPGEPCQFVLHCPARPIEERVSILNQAVLAKTVRENPLLDRPRCTNWLAMKLPQEHNRVGGLIEMLGRASPLETVVEVGSHRGVSTEAIAGHCRRVIAVDLWQDDDSSKQVFDLNLGTNSKVSYLRMASVDAARVFADHTIDLVYIDANHEYEDVIDDIRAWLPKIKNPGWIAGHDYSDDWPGVQRAVNEMFGRDVEIFTDSSWLVQVHQSEIECSAI